MNIVYLTGGIGGVKLLGGLYHTYDRSKITAIVNTGDDFEHWGLHISPDIDTVMYTLAGLADSERGWGLAGETFKSLEFARNYHVPDWFQLGDKDLATHIVRTQQIHDGRSLTKITQNLCRALGVESTLLPMSDGKVQTVIETSEKGVIPFQDWLVKHQAQFPALGVSYKGRLRATPEVLIALQMADAIVIGPSNPYVSIDPILSLGNVSEFVRGKPVVAVSPIVKGQAVRGPLASMMESIDGVTPTADNVLAHYDGMIDVAVVEKGDSDGVCSDRIVETQTVMQSSDDRKQLATEVLGILESMI